jgi:hypothetical protein
MTPYYYTPKSNLNSLERVVTVLSQPLHPVPWKDILYYYVSAQYNSPLVENLIYY